MTSQRAEDNIQETNNHGVGLQLADQISAAVTRGTTSRPDEVQILWVGEHLALVKHPGGIATGGWMSSWVDLVYRSNPRTIAPGGRVVHDSSSDVGGRLTKTKISALIEKAKARDADWLTEKEALDSAQRATEAFRQEKQRLSSLIRTGEQQIMKLAEQFDIEDESSVKAMDVVCAEYRDAREALSLVVRPDDKNKTA